MFGEPRDRREARESRTRGTYKIPGILRLFNEHALVYMIEEYTRIPAVAMTERRWRARITTLELPSASAW